MNQESSNVNNTNKVIYRLMQGLIVGLNAMIVLPAITYQLGLTTVSKALYFVLGFLCHQMPSRSFFFFGEKILYEHGELMPYIEHSKELTINFAERYTCGEPGCKSGVCVRCTGIYTGMLTGMVFVGLTKRIKLPKLALLAVALPMMLDGSIQLIAYLISPTAPFYESNNPRRFITGFLFGASFGLFAFSTLKEELLGNESPRKYTSQGQIDANV
jgi:uncharacterized membrane protein